MFDSILTMTSCSLVVAAAVAVLSFAAAARALALGMEEEISDDEFCFVVEVKCGLELADPG
jgi:hypothetical protein